MNPVENVIRATGSAAQPVKPTITWKIITKECEVVEVEHQASAPQVIHLAIDENLWLFTIEEAQWLMDALNEAAAKGLEVSRDDS